MNTTRLLRVLLFCPLFLLLLQQPAWAQSKSISGKVSDEKGSPVVGASIQVKGTKIGTTTDATGSFKLNVPSTAKAIVITYVGYADQTVTLDGSEINVSIKPDNTTLNDVVVIGYGSTRKKDLTGAVSSVQAKDFNQGAAVTAPDQLLVNKVAGLEVTQNSGQPGSASTVKIRGNNSIRAVNNPLYVIDGVPLDGRSARPNFGTAAFGSTPDANPLIYINPNDIQSIDVLKDASSAAIYGSRGANGVIAITTKTGSSGPTKLEFGTSFGVNAGYLKKYDILSVGQFRSALSKYGVTGQDKGASVDALKEIFNNKLSQNYNLAFSGGNENGKFRASFLGSTTQGSLKNSTLDKYIGSFAGQYKFLDKKLTLGFNLIAGHTTENLVAVSNNAGSVGNLISSALQWNPTTSFTDANGNFVYPTNGSGNPLALLAAYNDVASVNSVLGNISASYKILNNLEYKFLYAVNNSVGTRNTNEYGFIQGYSGLSGLGYGALSGAKLTSQTFTHTLNYKVDITAKLHLEALAGFEYWKSDYSNNSFSATGFNTNLDQHNLVIPYTAALQNGNTQAVPSTYVDPTTELQSYFGRLQFNYDDRFFVTGTIRGDGSSKFGKNNKYGYFPSVAGRWTLSNEDFLKGSNLFSNLSLRASWGITGNQEFPAGASQEQFRFGSYNNAGQINVANPNLKWEKTNSYNIGLDFTSKNGRVFGGIDVYNKNTTDILFQSTAIQPAPASIYFINLPANLINKGFELSLGFNLIDKKDLTWDIKGYFAYNDNKLNNFTQNGKDIHLLPGTIDGQGVSGTLGQVITNNQPVNEFYLKKFTGFDQSGNQTYAANPTFAGNPNNKTSYGISTSLNYKKFTLSLSGGGAGGFVIYNNTATSVTNIAGISNGRNIDKLAYNSAERPSSPVGANSRFLESGNFFKLRNAAISYRFGNVGKYVKNLNAFVNANNLFVITKFSGFDPEVNVDKSSNNYPSRSIEYLPYPSARIINFGLNFSL